MPKRLTDLGVEKMKAPNKRTFISDTVASGLYLVIQTSGKKSWVVGRRLNGKLVKMLLGHFPEFSVEQAREESKKYLQAFDRGEDPRDVRRSEKDARQATQAQTVAVVGETWLKRDQSPETHRSARDPESFYRNWLKPEWGNRPISSITKKDCIALIDKVRDEISINRSRRFFSFMHRMFAWCAERDILPFNPMTGAKKPGDPTSRERVLTNRELAEVWKASDNNLDGDTRRPNNPYKTNQYEQSGPIWGPIIKLLILTGARREEIGGLKWSEVDLENGVITLLGRRTKRLPKQKDKPRFIYLSQKAVDILEGVSRKEGCDYVFSATKTTPVSGWGNAKARLDKLIKTARTESGIKDEMPDWWIHDLRRTLATGFQKLNIRLEVAENTLGHSSGSRSGVVGVYARYGFEKESKEAVEIWANYIDDLLNGRVEEKVVSIKNVRAS
jgi:integrase